MALFFVLSATSLPSFGAATVMETGNDLIRMCKESLERNASWPEMSDDMSCMNFIRGVIEGYQLGGGSGLCIPGEVTYGQEELVAIQYAKSHPEQLHKPAAILIVQSFRKAFPCSDQSK